MKTAQNIVTQLLEIAEITPNGSNPWDIQINDKRWYERVFLDKSLGLGDSYIDGWWNCAQIDEMIYRLLRRGLENKLNRKFMDILPLLAEMIFNFQSPIRSRIVARRHYDLGNDLFCAFLDKNLQYSCAYFNQTDDLNIAQLKKLELTVNKLNLTQTDSVLDIGCGWGGLAHFIAQQFGCKVTAVNISKEQLKYAREICKGLFVDFKDCDYRAIDGQYDKIVSVGMFEHVGLKNYPTFMQVAHRCLKDDGIFLLHTIGNNVSQIGVDPWITKHIFPNSKIPSLAQITKAAEHLFIIENVQNIGSHYDKTLMAWNHNFQHAWPNLKNHYNEKFKRMWEYYLLSCAGSFRARAIQLWQIVMTKHGLST